MLYKILPVAATVALGIALDAIGISASIHFEEIVRDTSPGLNDDGSLIGELQLLSNQSS